MNLVLIEGVYINPEAVCLVESADMNDLGFQTEVTMQNGRRLFRTGRDVVAEMLATGLPSHEKCMNCHTTNND